MSDQDYTSRINRNLLSRQWFSYYDQTGLTLDASELEFHLVAKSYASSWATIRRSWKTHPMYYKRQAKRLLSLSQRDPSLPIRFLFDGFWQGFDPWASPIFKLLSVLLQHEKGLRIVDTPNEADVLISSCFPCRFSPSETDHCTKILFLGENIRPSYSGFDFSLTSHYFRCFGRNSYFPIWLYEILASASCISLDRYDNPSIRRLADTCCREFFSCFKPYDSAWTSRSNELVFVGSNYEPLRFEILRTIESSGIGLQVYGSNSRPVNNKYDIIGKHKFSICPENSFSYGYITEKLIHTLACGCRAVYWGGLPPSAISLLRSNGSIILDEHSSISYQLSPLTRVSFMASRDHSSDIERYIRKACRITLVRLLRDLSGMLSGYY
jgi:hypothetical protein